MGPYVSGFRNWLAELGYTPGTIRNMLQVLGGLGRWMEQRDLEPRDLTPAAIAELRDYCRDHGLRRVPGMWSFDPLLDFLRNQGVLAVPPVSLAPIEQLMVDYWLGADRGLAEATIVRYEKLARRFLHEHGVRDDASAASALTGADVVAFLLRESGRVNLARPRVAWPSCGSLLKFL